MRRRLLRACLRAYPRDVRERDGAALCDLADELAGDHGPAREALGLVRGGWAERRRRASRRQRRTLALVAAGAATVAAVAWSATAVADPGRVEVDRFGCASDCHWVAREVAQRVEDGWSCRELRGAAPVAWRCTLG